MSNHSRRRKKKKIGRILLVLLCAALACVFAYSAYQVYETVFAPGGYYQSNKNAQQVQQSYVTISTPASPTPTPQGTVEAEQEEEIILDPEVSPVTVDFDALSSRNSEIIAWLYCPNTVINYPVVQTDDNMYYLHKDIDGNYSSYGTLFVDCLLEKGFKSTNNVIYGHHMNDGKMFAKLVDYAYQSYYDEHPVMYLNTPDINYRVELFAGYVTSMDSDTYTFSFSDAAENQAWLDSVIAQSKFQSNVDVKAGDKILTLSTCTYDYDDARFVVLGKLVPIH